ncbi:MAG: 6-bladed beta-propeller, partial [Alistipes sp.]|nr:6-bladed beta-propeller [Alistipes sp.]
MKRRIYLIYIFLLMAVACSSSDQQDTATQLSVEVEERRPPLAASELFSSTDIVALEANDKSLIAGVDKVLMDKDFFAVVDKRSDKILTFRYDGSHIAT